MNSTEGSRDLGKLCLSCPQTVHPRPAANEKLILHQFLACLPDVASKQLRATGEVLALDGAIAQTRLLMSIDNQEQSAAVSEKPGRAEPSNTELLCEQVALLTEKVSALSSSSGPRSNVSTDGRPRPRRRPRCFGCNRVGHPCPYRYRMPMETQSCFACGQPDTLPEIATRETRTGHL